MNPTFKTLAVALLASLGVVACSSSGGNDSPSTTNTSNTVVPNQPTNASNNTSSTEAQGNQSTDQSSTSNEATNNNPSSNSSTTTSEEKPSQPSVTSTEEINSDPNKYVNTWRKQYVSSQSRENAQAENALGIETLRVNDYPSTVYPNASNEIINYDALSDGKLGYFSGTYKPENKSSNNAQALNYNFINQPYATYGILSSSDTSVMPEVAIVAKDHYNQPATLTGSASYKGQVISTLIENGQTSIAPKIDGTSEINVTFNRESATMSGVLHTDTVGKITLPETSSVGYFNNEKGNFAFTSFDTPAVEKFGQSNGGYNAYIVGENASEVVGSLGVSEVGSSKVYKATFGGVKQ